LLAGVAKHCQEKENSRERGHSRNCFQANRQFFTEKGQLVVYENDWTGWYAWVDRTRTPLLSSDWLSVNTPAGKHSYQFKYRPWDVWVGIFLSISGITLSIILWFRVRQYA
jgi:uncharacterized membrane protein YfhO